MKFGIDLARCHPSLWLELAQVSDELGFESLWVAEHVIFPEKIRGSPAESGHVDVDPSLPLFDPFVILAALGAKTEVIRLGTNVFNIGLRHPFVSARAVATADILSNGRIEFGVGVGWLRQEWDAIELDFASRGARVNEAIDICRSLWSDEIISHTGKFFNFESVVFNPKPAQQRIPIHIGGDSIHALRRVARRGDGWIGMIQTPETFMAAVHQLERECGVIGRHISEIDRTAIIKYPTLPAIKDWERAGATRLIVSPWAKSSRAIEAVRSFAAMIGKGQQL